MRSENRRRREAQIFDAAYKVLDLAGPDGLTVLAVARAARASNETLYRWFGDKTGLFAALVADNAERVETQLIAVSQDCPDAREGLICVGAALFDMVTSARAVALNRAAAADPSGTLGRALAAEGRTRVAPLLGPLIQQVVPAAPLDEAIPLFIDLLLGDIQIRRATGAMEEPPEGTGHARATLAVARLIRLCEPGLELPASSG